MTSKATPPGNGEPVHNQAIRHGFMPLDIRHAIALREEWQRIIGH